MRHHLPWSNRLFANNAEIKLASLVASSAALLSLILIFLAASEHEVDEAKMLVATVKTIAKPSADMVKTMPTAPDVYSQVTAQHTTSATDKDKPKASASKAATERAQPTTSRKKIFIGQGHRYIQVGAYQKLELAHLMLKKMKKAHKRAKIVKKGAMHAVWIGPVSTKEEALALKKRILRLNKITGFIIIEKP